MHGYMILAEGVDRHADGAFTVFRGGVNKIIGSRLPIPFRGALCIRLIGDENEAGNHVAEFECETENGEEIVPRQRHDFQMELKDGLPPSHNLVVQLMLALKVAGNYTFRLRVDNVEIFETTFRVIHDPDINVQR